jgi:hypothetical protein
MDAVGKEKGDTGLRQAPSVPIEQVAQSLATCSSSATSSGVTGWRMTVEKPESAIRWKNSGAWTRHWSQSMQLEST